MGKEISVGVLPARAVFTSLAEEESAPLPTADVRLRFYDETKPLVGGGVLGLKVIPTADFNGESIVKRMPVGVTLGGSLYLHVPINRQATPIAYEMEWGAAIDPALTLGFWFSGFDNGNTTMALFTGGGLLFGLEGSWNNKVIIGDRVQIEFGFYPNVAESILQSEMQSQIEENGNEVSGFWFANPRIGLGYRF